MSWFVPPGAGNPTRIQRQSREAILAVALDVFSTYGFRGATIDQIAVGAGFSKPNLLYYFESKEAIHAELLAGVLEAWLEPLRKLDPEGDPVEGDHPLCAAQTRDGPSPAAREPPVCHGDSARCAGAAELSEGAAETCRRCRGPDPPGLDGGRGPDRIGRSASPDLLDLGDHPALRRFRCPDPRGAGRRTGGAAVRTMPASISRCCSSGFFVLQENEERHDRQGDAGEDDGFGQGFPAQGSPRR